MINNPIIYKFFKGFAKQKKKTNWVVVLSCRPFPSIFKYRDHELDFPTFWKTRHFQTHIEKFS